MKVFDFNEEEEMVVDIENDYEQAMKNKPTDNKNSNSNKSKSADDDEEVTFRYIIKEILGLILYVVCIFVIVYLIINFVGQRTVVSGSSMENTLYDGDNLIVDKISYRFRDIERFDIVIFPYQYEPDTYYIKRVIGLPGETVYIDTDGVIYINNKVLSENYGKDIILNPGLASETILLGPDEYFVLGDNRNNSTDSRFDSVGNIRKSDIIGRAWVRMYPFSEIGFVEHQ